MDWYSLSRQWFDWSFENPEKVSPNHSALYFFAIEHCNRLWWRKKFWFPTEMAKDAIGIKSYHTYINTFNDLVEWGFIEVIERSKNQYSANIIALANFDKANDKALDKAIWKHLSKQQQSSWQSKSTIIKQIPTREPENQETREQDTTIVVWEQALVLEKWNTDINELLETIKWQVEFLGLIYKKGKYERERAKNILTGKDFWEVCEKANMPRIEFCKQIIFISSKLDFWNWKVYNAETIYKHYAQVYNEAKNKKQELEKKTPVLHPNPLCRF